MESPYICRCERITLEDVLSAVRGGATSVDGVKRRTRAGMGPCQGKTCSRIIARIIAAETAMSREEVLPARVRPPLRPLTLRELALAGSEPSDMLAVPPPVSAPPAFGLLADAGDANDAGRPDGTVVHGAMAGEGSLAERSYEFVVIGGGAVGSSITYHLARAGRDVALLEANDLATGTSGATQAWVWVHSKTPRYYMELNWRGARRYPGLSEELGIDLEYRRTGGMVGLFTQEEVDASRRMMESNQAAGVEIHLLTREEALSMEPRLSPEILAATYSPVDGNVNPFRVVQGFAGKAASLGARIHLRTAVKALEPDDGGSASGPSPGGNRVNRSGWLVRTNRGALRCRTLVIAAGFYTPSVARLAGVDVPVQPVRGQVLLTEAMPPTVRFTHQGVRQNPTGQVMLGYLSENAGFDKSTTLSGLSQVADWAIHYMPSFAETKVIHAFSGLRPMPKDKLSILSWARRDPPLFVAVTHSGITLSPVIGELVSEALMKQADGGAEAGVPPAGLEPYDLRRFAAK